MTPNPKKRVRSPDKPRDHPDEILKALQSLDTPEEKLAALCKKYTDLYEENRNLSIKHKQNQKKLTQIIRDKDQMQSDHSKSVFAKNKLENLCRELQRHNKLIKEESLIRTREEEEKRKEVTSKFQTTITEIQAQMNDHHSKNAKLRQENIELGSKLKSLIEQYETREKQVEKLIKHKDLEIQLLNTQLQQAQLQLQQEKERNLVEKKMLLTQLEESTKKIELLETQEHQLRLQVAMYTDKYEEFQDTLSKSNNVFQTFKSEIDKMTKKIKKTEKETNSWRTRWESSNQALLRMVSEKTKSDQEITNLTNKVKKLESLCRALQARSNKNSDAKENDSSKKDSSSPEDDIVKPEKDDNVKTEKDDNVKTEKNKSPSKIKKSHNDTNKGVETVQTTTNDSEVNKICENSANIAERNSDSSDNKEIEHNKPLEKAASSDEKLKLDVNQENYQTITPPNSPMPQSDSKEATESLLNQDTILNHLQESLSNSTSSSSSEPTNAAAALDSDSVSQPACENSPMTQPVIQSSS